MDLILLGLGLFLSLLLIPFGLPGTWAMVVAAVAFDLLGAGAHIGWLVIGVAAAIALVGEVLDVSLMARYAKQYGGSTRSAWGAVLGGLTGAIIGVPIPIVGSIIGAFAGAFVGALVLEATVHGDRDRAARAAWGAVVGRAVAAGAKVILGSLIAALLFGAALTR
ncbi:MAG: DUF456 domain-containing protein [Gemmatimonadetes bacterium]|nr:DUF456 domain-containing protein [Gemmatimonadota bacterium]